MGSKIEKIAFSEKVLEEVGKIIAKYPEGRQKSALGTKGV